MQLFYYVIIGDILAFCVGIYYYRYFSISYKLVLLHLLLTMVSESYGRYLATILHQHNVWLYNIYWLTGELWLMGFAGVSLLKGAKIKQILSFIILLSTSLWILGIYKEGIASFLPFVLLSIYITVLVIFFTVLFQSVFFSNEKIIRIPELWLCISVILYFGCNIPYYGLFNYLNAEDPRLLLSLFNITLILNLIRYPMVAYSFYLLGRQGLAAKQKLST